MTKAALALYGGFTPQWVEIFSGRDFLTARHVQRGPRTSFVVSIRKKDISEALRGQYRALSL